MIVRRILSYNVCKLDLDHWLPALTARISNIWYFHYFCLLQQNLASCPPTPLSVIPKNTSRLHFPENCSVWSGQWDVGGRDMSQFQARLTKTSCMSLHSLSPYVLLDGVALEIMGWSCSPSIILGPWMATWSKGTITFTATWTKFKSEHCCTQTEWSCINYLKSLSQSRKWR